MQSWYWLNQKKWCFKWAFVNAEFLRWAQKSKKCEVNRRYSEAVGRCPKRESEDVFKVDEFPFWRPILRGYVGYVSCRDWKMSAVMIESRFSPFYGEKEISRWVVVLSCFPNQKDFEMWESWCFGRLVQTKPYQKELSSGLVICCI